MYSLNNNVIYFDSFGVEYIPKEIRKLIGNKNIQTNIFRIEVYDSVMRGCLCIGFIDFMLKDKSLRDFITFFAKWFQKNDDIILNFLKNGWV